MAVKIDGKMVSAQIKANLAERVAALKEQGVNPGLGTILVGSDPGSVKYVAGKHADCAEIGVNSIKKGVACRRNIRTNRRSRTGA